MKVIATTLAIALAATLAAPSSAQQVRGIEGAIAHFNKSIDSPNQRIRPQHSRLRAFSTRSHRSTRAAPRRRLSRPAEIAFDVNNRSAASSTERRVIVRR
ncbi:MAG: hypothetical protein AAGF30_14810 [Pseudomonadota bacterium]